MKKARTPWPVATRVQYIVAYEHVHKKWGLSARRLHAHLVRRGVPCSLFSAYRILRRAGALVLRPRKPKQVWIRHAKEPPGERAQMDLKYLPQGLFQLTLIDDYSRYLAASIITKRTTAAVCVALPVLLKELPFPLRCIRTDNGSEFSRALTQLLKRLGIRHARTRPRTPRLNGKVERVHRTMQEEFWDAVEDAPPERWKPWLSDYVRAYNRRRIHSALPYKTPFDYALERLPPRARVSHMS